MSRESQRPWLRCLVLVGFLPLISCGDGTTPQEPPPVPQEPPSATVSMRGTVDVGPIPGVTAENLTIRLGASSARPDLTGSFSISGNRGTPGLTMAVDGEASRPVLFSVVANPGEEQSVELNLHSTALSMVFMAPYVVTADTGQTASTLAQIEALPEFADFESHLIQTMSTGAGALLTENTTTDSLFTRVVAAYIVKHVPDIDSPGELGSPADLGEAGASATQDIVIDPSFTKGGLKVTYEGGDKFKMTNDLGRWAYVRSPAGFFFVQPIDDLIDIIKKWDNPFLPSETSFDLTLGIGETKTVGAYGYGWHPAEDNRWENLTPQEQEWATLGGYTTITLEFIPAALSVLLNLRSPFSATEKPAEDILSFMGAFTGSQELSGKVGLAIVDGDALGVAWLVMKAFFNEFVTSPEFRTKVAVFMGIELTESAVGTVLNWAVPPVKIAATLDAAVAAGKTVLGFRNGRFKTVFTIYREATAQDYGNITGFVFEKKVIDSPPLQGATVILQGDEGNPLNPRLSDETNESGAYFFENITAGEKTIQVSKEGYRAASVTVTVVGNSTVVAPNIELSRESGTVSGRIINDILERHDVNQGLFQGEVALFVNEIGGENRNFSYTVTDGTYSKALPLGTYWVEAAHEDYSRDKVQVTVTLDQNVQAEDLLLFPLSSMTGSIELDLDGDNVYETTDPFTAFFTKASSLITDEVFCPTGSSRPFIRIQANTPKNGVVFYIAPALVDGPGYHDLGALDNVACSGSSVPAGLLHWDADLQCTNDPVPIGFRLNDLPPPLPRKPCNCGVTDPGEVLFDSFGSELTDVIQGSIISGTLPGWKNCSCWCNDEDGDGTIEPDECDVDCAKVRIRVDFKVLVGSDPLGQP